MDDRLPLGTPPIRSILEYLMNQQVPAVTISTDEWNQLKSEMSPTASPIELLNEMMKRLEAKKVQDDPE